VTGFAIRADALHTPERGRLEVLADTLIEVSAEGVIEHVGPADAERLAAIDSLVTLPESQYLLPGLVDLHVHAPQWPQLGKALDVPLEEWLQVHTFPLEARYADTDFAREVYAGLVDALLAHGTTTAVYFATIHVEATIALAEICLAKGQRALVGKVAMDEPAECPDFYRDADAEEAVRGTRAVIDRLAALQPDGRPLVLPVITPRFLPSCTEALLEGLGALARETRCHVQTHVSESDWEVAHGAARFGCSDAAALDGFGLLAPHAILAHSNFVTTGDRALIGEAGAAIAHCPLSNVCFAGEILPARSILDEGLRIGLGTDIAGGHSPSMLESARFAVTVSRVLERAAPGSAIGVADAFWMATAGGGEALGLPIGRFAPGFEFDAIAVDARDLAHAGLDRPEDIFEKIVRRAGRAEIARVWVRGRTVHAS
jgi:guanine deaminase